MCLCVCVYVFASTYMFAVLESKPRENETCCTRPTQTTSE